MEIAELAAVVEISQLQARYGDAVTRRAWAELEAMFATDARVHLDLRTRDPIEVTGGAEVARFIAGSVARFEQFEFAVLNALVLDVAGDDATGRMYIWELRQEDETWSNAFGVYDDRFSRHEGRWRFAERRYSSIARTFPEMTRTEVLGVPRGLRPQ